MSFTRTHRGVQGNVKRVSGAHLKFDTPHIDSNMESTKSQNTMARIHIKKMTATTAMMATVTL